MVSKIKAFTLLLSLFTIHYSLFTVSAHEGEDHSKDNKTTAAPTTAATASIVTAERNIQNQSGQFNLILKRSPGDPRTGETERFLIRLTEKVEGGFGGGEPVPLEKAIVSSTIMQADGTPTAENLSVTAEADGNYRTSYVFDGTGDYKIVFNIATEDKRNFSADFPVTVSRAPVHTSFWIGLAVLSLLTLASLGAVFYAARRKDEGKINYKKFAPVAAAIVLIFALGTVALAYFMPPREMRGAAEIPLNAPTETTNALETQMNLTVPKESQLLFGIKTEPVSTRKITSGLKTTGVVRSRPDSRAVVVPPVAGRIILRGGLTLGSAVGRGEQIGYVEQVLDVSGQTELESQRLEVEAQQREIEARRLEIKNTVLQLQSQQAEKRAKASQARTQLAQAQRELRRSENLVEVGAVPKKRVEEAQTAVKVAEQEVASAEQQVRLLDNQIKQTNAGQSVFRSPRVNQPTRNFPLTAPVTGIINEIKATSGQVVETGAEIASIVNLSTVLIEAQVFERDLPVVRESTRASFTNAALSGEVYNIDTAEGDGRLASIGQTVNEQTRTISVIYEVKNPLGRLKDGMFVELTVDTSGEREVLAVPKAAVVNEQGQTFVFVFDGGETFEKRAVALSAEGADYYEIKSGLKEGERVVTEGIYQLRSTQLGA
ncbi:MAG TPA: efflux RND transporter periplasmic adaptor subunit [Pyrinomonadaceae bacterium]|nr:efflux RND transporter periplasmic adaptor subunit [Pyrinomonadaceae bacterium]